MTFPDGEPLAFTDLIAQQSSFFRDALADAPDAVVRTCQEWRTDDLLWHLTEVQWFWATIVRDDVVDPDGLVHPGRPEGRPALLAAFDAASTQLVSALAALTPQTRRWMWAQDDRLHTAGYIARRQAHEALIHRLDAELTAGVDFSPIAPQLAADGVDELVRVMYGREHPLLTFAPTPGRTVALEATDTGDRWVLQLGRETGTVPDTGEHIDDPNFRPLTTDAPATATVAGTAADLDVWLWNRPPRTDLQRTGDRDVLTALDEILADGMQ